jgi:predicted nucleic acid-binding protein
MPHFYLESSALMKRYREEMGSEVMAAILEDTGPGERLYTSQLSILELRTVLARLARGRHIDPTDLEGVVLRIITDIARYNLIVLALDGDSVPDALDLLPSYALRAADALHLATAHRLSRQSVADLIVVTADQELGRACGSVGLTVLDPERESAIGDLRRMR